MFLRWTSMCRVNELVLKRRFVAGRKIEITKFFWNVQQGRKGWKFLSLITMEFFICNWKLTFSVLNERIHLNFIFNLKIHRNQRKKSTTQEAFLNLIPVTNPRLKLAQCRLLRFTTTSCWFSRMILFQIKQSAEVIFNLRGLAQCNILLRWNLIDVPV